MRWLRGIRSRRIRRVGQIHNAWKNSGDKQRRPGVAESHQAVRFLEKRKLTAARLQTLLHSLAIGFEPVKWSSYRLGWTFPTNTYQALSIQR